MADLLLESLSDLQDITDSFEKACKQAGDGDRIVLTKDNATTLLATINELWDEVSDRVDPAMPNKPLFLHVKSPNQEAYLQPSAIAIVAMDSRGNAVLNMVNGSNLQIEALQWQLMKKVFHSGVELVEVPSTGGLVKA